MELEEFKILLEKEIEKLNIKITQEQIQKFYNYMKLLIEWNSRINLTTIIKPKEIILKHFIDSLAIMKHIKTNNRVIDVGTGAGFPGIPIKILRPDIEIVLLDSLNKRINFLKEIVKKLNLKNIECIHSRAEEYANNKTAREKFDIVTSRAVANLSVLAEYTIPFLKINGKAILMKGPEIEEEIKEAKKAIFVLGGEIEEVEKSYLPDTDIKRNNIIIKKIKLTNPKYPRKAGTAKKEPIK